MRYIVTAIIAAVISGLIVGQLFRSAFEKQVERHIEAVVASSTLKALRSVQEERRTETPAGFEGPTGKPFIIGPSGPPPD